MTGLFKIIYVFNLFYSGAFFAQSYVCVWGGDHVHVCDDKLPVLCEGVCITNTWNIRQSINL